MVKKSPTELFSLHFSKSTLKSPISIHSLFSLLMVSKIGSKCILVKSRTEIPEPCLWKQPMIKFILSGRIISMNMASKLPGKLGLNFIDYIDQIWFHIKTSTTMRCFSRLKVKFLITCYISIIGWSRTLTFLESLKHLSWKLFEKNHF